MAHLPGWAASSHRAGRPLAARCLQLAGASGGQAPVACPVPHMRGIRPHVDHLFVQVAQKLLPHALS